jgi:PIN domain nuclease of toxin-antitoxin system
MINHALHAGHLERHHSDPFDRMLVSQAQLDGLALVTADPLMARYRVDVIW